MGSYVPSTQDQREEMLSALGISMRELYSAVPEHLLIDKPDIPEAVSELEVRGILGAMAAKNRVFPSIFRGAGAYNHYIPSIVKSVTAKEEFVTAYTPYQAEISQGVLQSIFEYQTMICELTGMDVSNASIYDGASAAAEAVAMCREKKRGSALISAASHPMVIQTVKTYCEGSGMELEVVPVKDGLTDMDALSRLLTDETACIYVQQPNYYGLIEEARKLGEAAHAAGAKFIMGVNPIACALLETPAECGADIAVGEGQPLGMPLAFGGPYLGFMTCVKPMMRKLPGRIVGETEDIDGRRAFVLTLQAREQHIRREKASSNVCSNQAHCALTASAYMSAMGPGGIRTVAEQCCSKAHYLAEGLCGLPGFELCHEGDFFNEFVTSVPAEPEKLLGALEEKGILGGLPFEGGILWCATEMNSKAQMDELITLAGEVCGI